MLDGLIEHTRYLRNPLDVLAQQIVAHVAITGDVAVDDLAALVRRTAGFAEISDELLTNVLDLLAGRYPSDEFNELRPRIVWDRVANTLRARDGSRRLAVTSGGTIPDRGLFGVFLPDGTRVGELDEEMVYESRRRDLPARRVHVAHRGHHVRAGHRHAGAGEPGRCRSGTATGRVARWSSAGRSAASCARSERWRRGGRRPLMDHYGLDHLAAVNVILYLDEQVEATGVVPDDRTVVIERFRDEIGDWRVCILTPFGTPVHAPWAMAIERRLIDHFDIPVETMWGDDGIVIRLPEAADQLPVEETADRPRTSTSWWWPRCRRRRCSRPGSASAPGVRCCCRAADRIAARRCGSNASVPPTCWRGVEVPDVPDPVGDQPGVSAGRVRRAALREVLTQLRSRSVRVVHVDTPKASPFAQSLLFNWIAAYMYEGDARSPSAERQPWRSTATCCATCSARRNCANCSTPACSPTWSWNCSASPTAAAPAARRTARRAPQGRRPHPRRGRPALPGR